MRLGAACVCCFLAFILASGCLGQPIALNETGLMPQPRPPTQPPADSGQEAQDFLASGQKIACTMGGVAGMQGIKIYMSGSSVRSEYSSPDTNETYITIIKGGSYYTKGGSGIFGNCSWVSFNGTAPPGGDPRAAMLNLSGGLGNYSAPAAGAAGNLPRCRPGNFSDEIFDVNGTVCDFQEITAKSLAGGAGNWSWN